MSDDWVKWIVAAALALVALMLWRAWQDKHASVAWPYVEGVITHCEAEIASPDPHHELDAKVVHASWRLRLKYDYTLGGQHFTGDRLRAMAEHFPTREEAARYELQFPVGHKVRVFYDPAQPSSSVLIQG